MVDNAGGSSRADDVPHAPRMRPRDVHLPVLVPERGGIIPLELKVRCLGPREGIKGVRGAEDNLHPSCKQTRSTTHIS